ncbi:GPW/gp25 family protein [Phaeobacter inhibens]|nr:GPW/gp25 family protein [Phaeobacter inhibens]UWR67083.1 GPW/gp25 family protein [Phaeobacter inhibens]
MTGMSRHSGRALRGDGHLAQSIHDILTTPKGSTVMLRDYGSDLPFIIDQPLNGDTLIDVYQATAEALALWEPRITLARVQVTEARPGYAVLELSDPDGNLLPLPVDLSQEASQ